MLVVGVRFERAGKIGYFSTDLAPLRCYDQVVVKSAKGLRLGRVVVPPDEGTQRAVEGKVLRKATSDDLIQQAENRKREEYARQVCLERIKARKLPMKLVKVSYFLDARKACFFFTAEGRIDFRALVRDLAQRLRIRIEMLQIGVRDEAKLFGGLGHCGRELCCSTFLVDFAHVSIRMAKDQGLSLNPSKVSGRCGRLMCCLVYEHDLYRQMRRSLPKVGQTIETPEGPGRVTRIDVLKRQVTLYLPKEERSLVLEGEALDALLASEETPHASNPGKRKRNDVH